MKVLLFPTCLADLLFPHAVEATVRVLERAGCEVEWRKEAVCCGQPAWNSGHVEEARRVAGGTLEALRDGDHPIVLCSGSCTTMIHEYWAELFEGTHEAADARVVAGRVHELSSFVAGELGSEVLEGASVKPWAVCYHDSCHMMRGLGVKDAPHELLGRIDGVEERPLDSPERCCGFGGTFSLRYPELSSAMADEKVDDIVDKGARTMVASDLGCLMQICGRAEARGIRLEGRYIGEVLDEATTAVGKAGD